MSTAVVLLGVSTAALGLVLVVVGRARLAKFVSYLPMPVIGGYLAFIGGSYSTVKWGLKFTKQYSCERLQSRNASVVSFLIN